MGSLWDRDKLISIMEITKCGATYIREKIVIWDLSVWINLIPLSVIQLSGAISNILCPKFYLGEGGQGCGPLRSE
jgi:hypothetical protein